MCLGWLTMVMPSNGLHACVVQMSLNHTTDQSDRSLIMISLSDVYMQVKGSTQPLYGTFKT